MVAKDAYLAMTNNKGNVDMARTLLISTATYMVKHIENKSNRLAYARAISRCQHIFSEVESGNDLRLMVHKLFMLHHSANKQVKKGWFTRESEYYATGIQHAIDVAESISIRFVDGYLSNTAHFNTDILEGAGDEHQMCACLLSFGRVKK